MIGGAGAGKGFLLGSLLRVHLHFVSRFLPGVELIGLCRAVDEMFRNVWNPDHGVACNVAFVTNKPRSASERRKGAGRCGNEFDVVWNLEKNVSKGDRFEGGRARSPHELNVDFFRCGLYCHRDLSEPRRGIVSKVHNDGLSVCVHGFGILLAGLVG